MTWRDVSLLGPGCGGLLRALSPARFPRLRLPWVLATVVFFCAASSPDVAGAAAVETAGEVLVVRDDGSVLTPPDPLPLAGRRLRFVPLEEGGFATQVGTLTVPPTRAAAAWRSGRRLDFSGGEPVAIELDVPFPFFGQLQRQVFVHPHGAISFGSPLPESSRARAAASGELLRSLAAGPPVIAGLWNELLSDHPADGTGVWFEQTEDAASVAWVGVPSARPANEPNTFRITLRRDGRIDLEYAEMASTWGIVGVSPGRGATATEMVDLERPIRGAPGAALLGWYRDLPGLDEVALSRAVFRQLPDRVQFLTVFTTRPVDGPAPVHGVAVKNGDRGIGLPVLDHGAVFGAHDLEHVVVMNDLSFWDDDPARPPRLPAYAYAPSTLGVLAHETGHRWLAEATTPAGPLGGDGHWSFFLDSGGSLLGGNRFRDNADGSFTTRRGLDGFGPLDLYLMGLRPAEEVPSLVLVEGATGFEPPISVSGRPFDAQSRPEEGITFRGRPRTVTIDEVVHATGKRQPAFGEAPRSFRMAFVLVVPSGGTATDEDLAKVERIRHAFGPFFQSATGGLGRMGTALPRGVDATPPPDDLSLRSGEPQLLAAEIRPRGPSRWALKIEFADLGEDLTSVELLPDTPGATPTVVEVTTAAYGVRLGAMTIAVRDLPADVRSLRVSLLDRRGQRSHVATRWLPGRG
ncbi:MAG: hypothetical protein RL698_903 [Pseudomonadota bacterium]